MEERLCRVCLSIEGIDEFNKIFERNLALKIFLITNVKIIESQSMPALICKSCEIEVYQCINFRKKIQSSQEYFNNQMPYLESFFESNMRSMSNDNHEMLQGVMDINETIEEYLEDEEETFESPAIEEIKKDVTKSIELEPIKRLSCKYCGLELSRRQRLIQHERLHFIEKSNKYTCDKCGKNFNQRFGLIPHFQKRHDFKLNKFKEKWKCAICENKILPPGNMEVHYQKFHKESFNHTKFDSTENSGEILLKKKHTKNAMKSSHIDKELNKVPKVYFPCEICGNSFTTSSRYYKHLNDLHGVREKEILKNEVTSEYLSNEQIIESNKVEKHQFHPKRHKKFPCSTCGKMFANLNTCKTHEKIHSGLRFFCDLCGSSFSMKPYLTSHVQKVHLKLKRFKCSMCTKTFVHRELLNYHIKKHLNIRNYSCQFCQKTFVRKACAMIHERIHKNERPYSCKYCDRQFIHHSDHRRHELRHTNDISFL